MIRGAERKDKVRITAPDAGFADVFKPASIRLAKTLGMEMRLFHKHHHTKIGNTGYLELKVERYKPHSSAKRREVWFYKELWKHDCKVMKRKVKSAAVKAVKKHYPGWTGRGYHRWKRRINRFVGIAYNGGKT